MPAIITARDWTMVAWCKYRSSAGVKSGFKLDNGSDDNDPPNTNCMISFYYSSGNWVVEGLNDSLALGPTVASAATADTWYMLAIRCADNVAQNPRYRYSVNAGALTAIGAGGAGARDFNTIGFFDSVDEVQIYEGTDASPVNLSTIYNAGAPTEFSSPYPSTMTHYWKFNNNVTDTVGGFTLTLNSGGSFGTGILNNDLQWSGTGLFGASNTSDVAVETTKSHGTVGWLSHGTGKSTFYIGGAKLSSLFITDSWLIDQYVGSKLYVFGVNQFGQLGDNSITNRSAPVQTVDLGNNWEQAARNFYVPGGVKSDGTLWMWGYNTSGQLGDNTSSVLKSSPVQTVAGGTNWKYLSASNHAVATKTDNTIWTWGSNGSGQLGDNTTVSKSSPIQVGNATNWLQATGGFNTSAAIKDDNTLWIWGSNAYGQLGDNTTVDKSSPIQVTAGSRSWSYVSVSDTVAAIATDYSLWTWGTNIWGQLGDNSTTYRSSPVQVVTKSNDWFRVSAGGNGHMAGIKTDGTLWLWGFNGYGQLGDNTVIRRSSPVQTVAGGNNWKYVSCGYKHTAAIKTDGTLWVWGNNSNGALGDGTTNRRSSPVQTLAGGSLWKQVECGYDNTFATTFSG